MHFLLLLQIELYLRIAIFLRLVHLFRKWQLAICEYDLLRKGVSHGSVIHRVITRMKEKKVYFCLFCFFHFRYDAMHYTSIAWHPYEDFLHWEKYAVVGITEEVLLIEILS